MLHLNSSNPHHESGPIRVERDSEMIVKVMAAMETNPFTATTTSLINISTGQCAEPAVKDHLINVKELGLRALSESISGDQKEDNHCATEDIPHPECKDQDVQRQVCRLREK